MNNIWGLEAVGGAYCSIRSRFLTDQTENPLYTKTRYNKQKFNDIFGKKIKH